jgi:hypothetical protein
MGFILIGLIGLIVWLIARALKKGVSGVKVMLLGISLILFAGIISIEFSFYLAGVQYLIVILGFIISVIGFIKKD